MTTSTEGSQRLTRVALSALALRLDVAVEDRSLAATLSDLFGDLVAHDPERRPDAVIVVLGTGPWTICSPGHTDEVATRSDAVAAVLAAVNLTAVGSTRLLALHAGVLARDGRVLVMPAPSGAGKSTLTAALMRAGWSYVSDEALCLTWSGHVVPYPRPLALSHWSAAAVSARGIPVGPEVALCPRDLGASTATSVGRVTDVVLLSRGAGPPTLAPVDRQEVVAELLLRSFTHFLAPARALQLYGEVVRAASCYRLTTGDPTSSAELLTQELGRL